MTEKLYGARTFGDLLMTRFPHETFSHACAFCDRNGGGVTLRKYSVRHYVCDDCIGKRRDVVLPAIVKAEKFAARLDAIRARTRPTVAATVAALEHAIAGPAVPQVQLVRLAGRCADGCERGAGHVVHAVAGGSWRAICGKQPGRLSAGWADADPRVTAPTCPRCRRELAEVQS